MIFNFLDKNPTLDFIPTFTAYALNFRHIVFKNKKYALFITMLKGFNNIANLS